MLGGNTLNPAYYLPIFALFLILFITTRTQKQMLLQRLIEKRKTEDKTEMVELAKKFIDKECLIYTFNGGQIDCTVKEVSNGALLVETNGTIEAINLDFVMRIREYPRNKKGKKKSVVLD